MACRASSSRRSERAAPLGRPTGGATESALRSPAGLPSSGRSRARTGDLLLVRGQATEGGARRRRRAGAGRRRPVPVLQSRTSDANGNLTSDGAATYAWDPRGQLASVTRG